MPNQETIPNGPERVPFLMSQPLDSENSTAPQQVNRYGTYEIQPTSDTEHFFPTIAAGTYDDRALHLLRLETMVGTGPDGFTDLHNLTQ